MLKILVLSALAIAGAGAQDLKYERPGGVFSHPHAPACGADGVIHNGSSTGVVQQINGESLYLAYPRNRKTDTALLYLTDVFGIQLVNNRLLADAFARAGYFVVAPDLFRGDPVPADALDPGSTYNLTAWFARHPTSQVESIIASALDTLHSNFHASTIGTTGYCFGGRFVARLLNSANSTAYGVKAGFAAHPSNALLSEWDAISQPVSVAFGSLDTINTPQNRTDIEAIFATENKIFQTALYGGAAHGFGVRVDLSDPKAVFAQESAYFQAVRWFNAWLKDEI